MQFKHPEILYALFLLLIPIIIHLFQLRRFQKVDFTNVAFLKKVTIQTRKSSQLKKWLTLLMRLLALACIIFAFAQPFSASKTALNSEKETVLYIDNSFSMQAKGPNGPLLQRALQQLYEKTGGANKISWFSNSESKKNVTSSDFKNEVLDLEYDYRQMKWDEVLLKAKQLFSKSEAAAKRLIVISDFQQRGNFPSIDEDLSVDAVGLEPVTQNNIAIDSAYILTKNTTTTQLNVMFSGEGEVPENVPVSLYNGNVLIAKTAVDFSESTRTTLTFDIENASGFRGELHITDPNLLFDNSLFFSINTPKKIKVLSINEGDANFLQRLFNQEAYEYTQQSFNNLNYNDIPAQNFIVVNNLKNIPVSLVNSLKAFSDGGGTISILPAVDSDVSSYNTLLNSLGVGNFSSVVERKKQITKINFSHPLYTNVFEKQVANFQYPTVNSYFPMSSNATRVLGYEDGSAFLLQMGNTFVSSASFSEENSNVTFSPLVVPTFINMAQQSLPLPRLYYHIGALNTFAVPVTLTQDAILTLRDSLNSFIPLQRTKANSVEITTREEPSRASNFRIENEANFVENISYNYPREESKMVYSDPADWQGVTLHSSVAELFDAVSEENKVNSFWKWFVIFAVVFLLLEMLILKFYR